MKLLGRVIVALHSVRFVGSISGGIVLSALRVCLLGLVAFHTLDHHVIWVNPTNVYFVRGAGQIGYPDGTLVGLGATNVVVTENVVEVVKRLEGKK